MKQEPKLDQTSFTSFVGLLGHPVNHSLSPVLFKLIQDRMNDQLKSDSSKFDKSLPPFFFEYQLIDIPPCEFETHGHSLIRNGRFLGFNITLPYKTRIIPLLDDLSEDARAIGSVNVVQIHKTGFAKGYNTDIFGIQKTFEEQNYSIRGKQVLIFGAGGSAFTVGYRMGVSQAKSVVVVNRTVEKAQALISKLSFCFPKTDFKAESFESFCNSQSKIEIDLFINTTPIGMKGFEGNIALQARIDQVFLKGFSKRFLPTVLHRGLPKELSKQLQCPLAFDLVYTAETTPFLEEAKKFGIPGIGGLDMLIWQALGAWEIWFGPLTKTKSTKSNDELYFIKKELKEALRTHLNGSYQVQSGQIPTLSDYLNLKRTTI